MLAFSFLCVLFKIPFAALVIWPVRDGPWKVRAAATHGIPSAHPRRLPRGTPPPTWQIVSLVLSCFAWLWLLVGFGVYVDKCLPTDEISFDGGIDLNFIPVSG